MDDILGDFSLDALRRVCAVSMTLTSEGGRDGQWGWTVLYKTSFGWTAHIIFDMDVSLSKRNNGQRIGQGNSSRNWRWTSWRERNSQNGCRVKQEGRGGPTTAGRSVLFGIYGIFFLIRNISFYRLGLQVDILWLLSSVFVEKKHLFINVFL